jgi:molybdopterin-guanine dinucleotide biosynthesis protein A
VNAAGLTVLVLAGRRQGPAEPLAAAAGVTNKALLPLAGMPMIRHVLAALQACPGLDRIIVSAEPADRILQGAGSPPGVEERASGPSPSGSVAAALAEFGTPLLVTTADHALLTPEMAGYFLAAVPEHADAAAGVARSDTVLAAYPGAQRTWLRFRGGAFSGCNLFLLRTPAAARAVAFWQQVEAHRKRPLAMARLVGLTGVMGYALRLLTLSGAVRLLERRVGARLAVVELPFADAAVDVDKPADLLLVRQALAGRVPG